MSIYSTEFLIEIVNNGQKYEQLIENSTKTRNEPSITKTKEKNYTSVTFFPNFELLKMKKEEFNEEMKQILYLALLILIIENIKKK